ncbi:DUF4183 domain-containing protein [Bacillus lacus]|uniref:DUF4183 domain-containing protein n=1 Tax=Metabacillus lacus TaxID=1983721 RepID=A0A7X2M1F3_9BACI|nr:DUF4183 domain-containing protein [Metabacillus lacus]MRX74254.1 DUF4183 domain-containing protein [Metabacillus lacus]
MSRKIIKLAVTSDTQVSVVPSISCFFHEITENLHQGTDFKIEASQFLDDSGKNAESLPHLNPNNSYFNVYVNGIVQMADNFAYTAGEGDIGNLIISVPEESFIPAGTPVIIEVVNFKPVIHTTYGT